jgi:O-antigen/teichoic acid export membrane protein
VTSADARAGSGEGRSLAWGFVAQGSSSVTTFGLSLVAGRALGPEGLGAIFIGFTLYLAALGLQRALVTVPLVSSSAALPSQERERSIRSGLTTTTLWASCAALSFVLAGILIPGEVGRTLLVFGLWLPAALLQNFWRAILFQERKGRAAAFSDVTWLLAMTVAAPLAWVTHEEWAVVSSWGFGGLAGLAVGFSAARQWPERPARATTWWRLQAWPFGRWLGVQEMVFHLASYALIFVLPAVIGTRGLGGLRAAESLFAPFSLVATAIGLPGLPAVSRAIARTPRAGKSLAVRLSALAIGVAVSYVAVMILIGEWLLVALFGQSFEPFTTLIWPIGVWQVIAGAGVGFGLLLSAEQRGRETLLSGAAGSAAVFGFVSILAWTHGVTGAAWGLASASAVSTLLTMFFALRTARSPLSPARGSNAVRPLDSDVTGFAATPER